MTASSQNPGAAILSARSVLAVDRVKGGPWKRILTAEQEVGLAHLMRDSEFPLERELPEGYRAGLDPADDRARAFDALMTHNIRLVWSIARKYVAEGLEPEDIANYGMIGLRRAVEKFNASKGYKFSTYAVPWIHQAIRRGIDQDSRLIRLPVHVVQEMNHVLRARERLTMANRPFTATAIAYEIGLPVRKVVELLRLETGVVSLDKPVNEEGGDALGDFVLQQPDGDADPAQIIDRIVLRQIIEEALQELPEREALIMRMRAGLDTDEPATLDDVGKVLGVTRERIRQLEVRARTKLLAAFTARGLEPVRASSAVPTDTPAESDDTEAESGSSSVDD